MKKISRKDLQGLRRQFPVLSKDDMRQYVGGYDGGGYFSGGTGYGWGDGYGDFGGGSGGYWGGSSDNYYDNAFNYWLASGNYFYDENGNFFWSNGDYFTDAYGNPFMYGGSTNSGYGYGYGGAYELPEVEVTADGRVITTFKGIGGAPMLAEGAGMRGFCKYEFNTVIENGNIAVMGNIFTSLGNDAQVFSCAHIYVNGVEMECRNLSVSSSLVYQQDTIPLGSTEFNLSQYHGQVEVVMEVGYNYDPSGTGPGSVNFRKTVYSSYR